MMKSIQSKQMSVKRQVTKITMVKYGLQTGGLAMVLRTSLIYNDNFSV